MLRSPASSRTALLLWIGLHVACGGQRLDLGRDKERRHRMQRRVPTSRGAGRTSSWRRTNTAPRSWYRMARGSIGTAIGTPRTRREPPSRSCVPSNCKATLVDYAASEGQRVARHQSCRRFFGRDRRREDRLGLPCRRLHVGTGRSCASATIFARRWPWTIRTSIGPRAGVTRTSSARRSPMVDGTTIFSMTPPVLQWSFCLRAISFPGPDLYVVTGSSGTVKRAVSTLPKDRIWTARQRWPTINTWRKRLTANQARVYWANSHIGGTVVACARTGCQGCPRCSRRHNTSRRASPSTNGMPIGSTRRTKFSKGEIVECALAGCGNAPNRSGLRDKRRRNGATSRSIPNTSTGPTRGRSWNPPWDPSYGSVTGMATFVEWAK